MQDLLHQSLHLDKVIQLPLEVQEPCSWDAVSAGEGVAPWVLSSQTGVLNLGSTFEPQLPWPGHPLSQALGRFAAVQVVPVTVLWKLGVSSGARERDGVPASPFGKQRRRGPLSPWGSHSASGSPSFPLSAVPSNFRGTLLRLKKAPSPRKLALAELSTLRLRKGNRRGRGGGGLVWLPAAGTCTKREKTERTEISTAATTRGDRGFTVRGAFDSQITLWK